MPCYHEAMKIN